MKLRDLFFDDTGLRIRVVLISAFGFLTSMAYLGLHGPSYKCEQVCTASGDGNAYHWTLGCRCKDARGGFYDPKDGR